MARRSGGGGRPMSRPAPRRSAPPPAKVAPAPAPATTTSGGGMLSGIGSTIAQGLAFGTGSAVAHRAVDSVMGPRTIQYEGAPSEAASSSPAAMNSAASSCNIHSKAFEDCLNNYGSEISKCQFYLDMLTECRKNSTMSV
ncbi:hypothetical protein AQUCO_01000244v1 [Aquilegia coerulea]|uniref:CHCH domain-containing protein n=1 Tax=Aquilegia coerulea TaxID=218851 RepID=A0A2G5E910_AQUCA|nr:hypothetical protein AQUCO_01000244v1 [Aquilegia coerulea]